MRRLLAAGLVAGVLLSIPLWLSDRPFPLLPRLPFVPALPPPLDRIALVLLLGLAGTTLVRSEPRRELAALLALLVALVAADHTRCQPWVYQYAVMLLIARGSDGVPVQLTALRVMTAAIYLWSGLQKLNPVFFVDTAPWFMEPLASGLPAALRALVERAGYALPVVEIALGTGLLIPRLRAIAVLLGTAMHLGILLAIGPLGHDVNAVVWPWNAVMIGLLWTLFARERGADDLRLMWRERPALVRRAAVLAFAALPALNFAGLWDSSLSWSLYSGMMLEVDVLMDDTAVPCLPAEAQRNVQTTEDGTKGLSLWQWASDVLDAPPYPERWVYRRLGTRLCSCDPDRKLIVFQIWEPRRTRLPESEFHRCGEAW